MQKTNFLFSSVGDNTNFDDIWINENMNYDIYVIYYGENEANYNKYASKVKFIEKRKGSKFQNFKYFYENNLDIINKYERFFILDDDINMNVNDINEMFNISKKYNLGICGPSFSKKSKAAWDCTKHKPGILLSYTNFVEVNVPLFNKECLQNLMNKLDSNLVGWGIDLLYIFVNGIDKKDKYAIIHKIICTNPKDEEKNNKNRELTLVKNCDQRIKLWNKFAKKNNLPNMFKDKVYSSILL